MCVLVLEQGADDVLLPGFHQGVCNGGRKVAAHRDRQQMLGRAVAHDLDEIGILQHLAADQHRTRNVDLVIGEQHRELARRAGCVGQFHRELATDLARDFADQLFQDVGDEGAFLQGEDGVPFQEHVPHRFEQLLARLVRLLSGQRHQLIGTEGFQRHPRPTLAIPGPIRAPVNCLTFGYGTVLISLMSNQYARIRRYCFDSEREFRLKKS
jgi:hypothetical protein